MTISGRLDGTLSDASELKSLGSNGTSYTYEGADAKLLEAFPNPMKSTNGSVGTVRITAPEFTSLCPKTGQPDFATIVINYDPDELCVESKSLKLYLGSFRNTGEFHEACIQRICTDLVELLNPHSITVVGEFTPRGGISFHPTVTWEREPDRVMVVDTITNSGDRLDASTITADMVSAGAIRAKGSAIDDAPDMQPVATERPIFGGDAVATETLEKYVMFLEQHLGTNRGAPTIDSIRQLFFKIDKHLRYNGTTDAEIVRRIKHVAHQLCSKNALLPNDDRAYRDGRMTGGTLSKVLVELRSSLAAFDAAFGLPSD